MTTSHLTDQAYSSKTEQWFDDLVATLRSHQIQLETNTANNQVKSLYETLMASDHEELLKRNRVLALKYFVPKMLIELMRAFSPFKEHLQKLAVDFNSSELLLWIQLPDNYEKVEDQLLLASSRVSLNYKEYGFAINVDIVEEEDKVDVPQHYQIIID
jgi:hypothetical protein